MMGRKERNGRKDEKILEDRQMEEDKDEGWKWIKFKDDGKTTEGQVCGVRQDKIVRLPLGR